VKTTLPVELLLKQLINIPSYLDSVNETKNENQLVDFIEQWVQENTLFATVRQILQGGRYNLIIKSGDPRTLFLAHTDTVPPSVNARFDQLQAIEFDGEIWGRGATDMKSGIACLMKALLLPAAQRKNFWMVFYADEEQQFLGMKEFIKRYRDIRPKLIVSADGSDLQIGNGCRGLIDLSFRIKGETGHPAKETGNSAIQGTIKCLDQLGKFLATQTNGQLGNTPWNVAYMFGGSERPDSYHDGQLTVVGKQGNVVPDVCECVLDIRPAPETLSTDEIETVLREAGNRLNLKYESVSVGQRLGSWFTDPVELDPYLNVVRKIVGEARLSKPQEVGYIDLQMAWSTLGKPPALTFGAGLGSTSHKPDERISIGDLRKGERVFAEIMTMIE
jgi:acetylornithine deacetylase/succinyl-diaminopimelate desuccinylase-like protein